jgi:hypothetical protein
MRIQGTCILGGVEIVVRRSGETSRDARARERSERNVPRARRRLSGEE